MNASDSPIPLICAGSESPDWSRTPALRDAPAERLLGESAEGMRTPEQKHLRVGVGHLHFQDSFLVWGLSDNLTRPCAINFLYRRLPIAGPQGRGDDRTTPACLTAALYDPCPLVATFYTPLTLI